MTDTPLLLLIPDPCQIAVMQCLTDDPISMFSAARAHIRLHQAAVVALSSITVNAKTQQQLDDSLLPYLGKHGQHVDSMVVRGAWDFSDWVAAPSLRQLPTSLQLTSLQLEALKVQLQPGNGFQGVLRPGLPLKQLRLGAASGCCLQDEEDVLAAALHGLPALEHFSIVDLYDHLAEGMLQELQQLTYLDLYNCQLDYGGTSLQPLQALTGLVDLRVSGQTYHPFTTDMLSGLCSLTRLVLDCWFDRLEPAGLAGKTQLQHLSLYHCNIAGVERFLSELQHLTHLTHLGLSVSYQEDGNQQIIPHASAFSALTASSKLQHLSISHPPAAALQHLFPAGRQLPHLQSLSICNGAVDGRGIALGSSLVSCCPALRSLDLQYYYIVCSAARCCWAHLQA